MSKHSHAMESFSRFVVAMVGALALAGAVAFAFVAIDDHGCSSGTACRTASQMHETHY